MILNIENCGGKQRKSHFKPRFTTLIHPAKFITRNNRQFWPATWPWMWLQSRSYACPRCETPHRLQFKFHLAIISTSDSEKRVNFWKNSWKGRTFIKYKLLSFYFPLTCISSKHRKLWGGTEEVTFTYVKFLFSFSTWAC